MAFRRSRRGGRRRNTRFVKKAYGGKTKQLVDGHKTGSIRANSSAIPYLIKSVGMLKSMNGAEAKYIDTGVNVSPTSSGLTYVQLTAIDQGTEYDERIGRKVLLSSVSFKYTVTINGSAMALTYANVRIVIFVDKEADNAAPITPAPYVSPFVTSLYNLLEGPRYVIIKDWNIALSTAGSTSAYRKFYKKLNFQCYYDGVSGAVANAKQNQLYIGIITDVPANPPQVFGFARVKYYDS